MIVVAIVSFVFTLLAGLVMYIVAKRRADHGLMPVVPPAKFPAAIVFDGLSQTVVFELQWAMSWWNRQLGNYAFADVGEITSGLTLTVDEDKGGLLDNYYARLKFRPGGLFPYLVVNMWAVRRNPHHLRRAMAHELGHLLGLDHDDDPASVMYPRAVDGAFCTTSKDIYLVRDRLWPE